MRARPRWAVPAPSSSILLTEKATSFSNARVENGHIQVATSLYMALECSLLRRIIGDIAHNRGTQAAALPDGSSLRMSMVLQTTGLERSLRRGETEGSCSVPSTGLALLM